MEREKVSVYKHASTLEGRRVRIHLRVCLVVIAVVSIVLLCIKQLIIYKNEVSASTYIVKWSNEISVLERELRDCEKATPRPPRVTTNVPEDLASKLTPTELRDLVDAKRRIRAKEVDLIQKAHSDKCDAIRQQIEYLRTIVAAYSIRAR